jgi:hypothetical protein
MHGAGFVDALYASSTSRQEAAAGAFAAAAEQAEQAAQLQTRCKRLEAKLQELRPGCEHALHFCMLCLLLRPRE